MIDQAELQRRAKLWAQGYWEIPDGLDTSGFNFDWRPLMYDRPYIHQFGTQWQKTGGPRFVVPESEGVKYQDCQKAIRLPDQQNWVKHFPHVEMDWSWHPDDNEPPFIYVFGNQHLTAPECPTVEYHAKDAVEQKYVGDRTAKILSAREDWVTLLEIDEDRWDFSWSPHPWDPPYIYVWGNNHLTAQECPTVEYHAPGATERKYMNDRVAQLRTNPNDWRILHNIKSTFDFSWTPHPWDPPYIYVWGNQFLSAEEMPTVEYHAPGAVERKYMDDQIAVITNDPSCWHINNDIKANFNFDWTPHPWDPPYIYVWGNQFLSAEEMPTVEYRMSGATEYKYMDDQVAVLVNDNKCWHVLSPINKSVFNWDFVPHPWDPPYIYVWGNQFLSAEEMPTVEYHVPGATERRYMDDQHATLINDDNCWSVLVNIDKSAFNWDFVPHPWDPPYIYVWGNQFLSAEEMPTVQYAMPGATEYKYMDDQIAVLVNDSSYWNILSDIDKSAFNWDFVPHPWDPPYIYVWGNQFLSAEEMPTVEYVIPGATERKYMNDQIAMLINNSTYWTINHNIDRASFDWSFVPHPWDPPYIYVWGNQFLSAEEMPTVEYRMPGATEYKYMDDQSAKLIGDSSLWTINHNIDKAKFDWSWSPHPWDPPYIYVWGNQFLSAEEMPTVEYRMSDATEYRYMDDQHATLVNNPDWWEIKHSIHESAFDWSFVPHPWDPPYIYVWGNQFLSAEEMPTVLYHVPGATEYKYMDDQVAKLANNPDYWSTVYPVVKRSFDWSWTPHPHDPPFIYTWGNEWNDAATEPTVMYHVPGATEHKYMDDVRVKLQPDMSLWTVPNAKDLDTFDFSWRPNPHSPPQIYQWEDNGPIYTVPGATEVVLMSRDIAVLTEPYIEDVETKSETPQQTDNTELSVQYQSSTGPIAKYYVETTLEDLIEQHHDEVFWALNKDLKYDNFNFKWKPNETNFRHINVFGSSLVKDTQTYYVNAPLYKLGYREFNYVEDEIMKIETKLSMFYIDVGGDDGSRYEALKQRYPQLIKTRFLNSWVDTIKRCLAKSETRYIWILSSENDYSKFEFNFYPGVWQRKYIHVFGTQWSHWGNTYFINTETFVEDTKYVKVIEHLKNINHVRSLRAPIASCNHDIVWIDHGNTGSTGVYEKLSTIGRNTYRVPYNNSYLHTLKDWIESMDPTIITQKNYRVWITSSVCDYSNFDFTWRSDPFETRQLHVFASEFNRVKQKFGDTMFVSVADIIEYIKSDKTVLEDYTYKVNYISYLTAQRLQHPVIEHQHSSQVDAVLDLKNTDVEWPYVELRTSDMLREKAAVPSLWSVEHQSVIVNSTGASQIYVPSIAIPAINREIYDYERIVKSDKLESSGLLDIVFISNGEPIAEENWAHLMDSLMTRGIKNRVHRVSDVNGRIRSQHAAAHTATTGWYFLINAKIQISDTFDWNWQPDRLQERKHYIFTVTNPVNGLQYGHQAIVANNRELTLETNRAEGLDFTLQSPHEVVEMNCGTAVYNIDPWTTWRTAFREAVKLRNNTDEVSISRLQAWITIGNGDHGEWSVRGAVDGVEFWQSVNGEMIQLLKSYEWDWLKQLFESKYGTDYTK